MFLFRCGPDSRWAGQSTGPPFQVRRRVGRRLDVGQDAGSVAAAATARRIPTTVGQRAPKVGQHAVPGCLPPHLVFAGYRHFGADVDRKATLKRQTPDADESERGGQWREAPSSPGTLLYALVDIGTPALVALGALLVVLIVLAERIHWLERTILGENDDRVRIRTNWAYWRRPEIAGALLATAFVTVRLAQGPGPFGGNDDRGGIRTNQAYGKPPETAWV